MCLGLLSCVFEPSLLVSIKCNFRLKPLLYFGQVHVCQLQRFLRLFNLGTCGFGRPSNLHGRFPGSNKCLTSSNKCIATRNKCLTSSNNKNLIGIVIIYRTRISTFHIIPPCGTHPQALREDKSLKQSQSPLQPFDQLQAGWRPLQVPPFDPSLASRHGPPRRSEPQTSFTRRLARHPSCVDVLIPSMKTGSSLNSLSFALWMESKQTETKKMGK